MILVTVSRHLATLCALNNGRLCNSSKIMTGGVRKCHYVTSSVKRRVVVSESNDIYTNLALEDWYLSNSDFEQENILMLWRNSPCVVIGKFQNPWREANITYLTTTTTPRGDNIRLARRASGGGTVYHDMGNINLTFFTARGRYNRKDNLNFISSVLLKEHNLNAVISPREDLILDGKKISGTAAKLLRTTAYHHCTLLVSTDKTTLHNVLTPSGDVTIVTNASKSIKSPTVNLTDVKPDVTTVSLLSALAEQYSTDVTTVNPDEDVKLTAVREQMASWQWLYGKTPKFTATMRFKGFQVVVMVTGGLVTEIECCNEELLKTVLPFKGLPYSDGVFCNLEVASKVCV